MPLTVPVWIIAIATVIMAISVAIATVVICRVLAARSSRQQEFGSQLGELLRVHARDLRHSVDERRRAQACRVFIELDRASPLAGGGRAEISLSPWQVTATVHNASDQPVYDLYVIWQHGNIRIGKPDRAARLLPGAAVCFERDADSGAGRGPRPDAAENSAGPGDLRALTKARAVIDPAAVTAFLTFRDTAGTRWTVREDGTLSDISPANPDTPAPQD